MNLSPCAYVFGSGIHWFVVVRAALVDLKQAQILEPSNKAVSLSGRVLCMDIFEYIYVCVFVADRCRYAEDARIAESSDE